MTEYLAKDWIQRLWQLWSTIRDSRRGELTEITNTFGNPELLASTYIEPDCQRINPADHDEEEAYRTFRQPIRKWLNGFLSGEFFERDGRNTLFVLSDAGMGKSSLLMMLKLTHMLSFWPNSLSFRLEKLGQGTLETIGGIERQNKTILLLDALDEDDLAWGRIEERLGELLHATKGFRQVILTCRTQFFPEGGQTPIETPEKVEVAGFVCNLLYLSPFSDEQVEAYLHKRFPNGLWARMLKRFQQRDNPKLEKARALLEPMKSLRMRPMLLSNIDMLMEAEIESMTEYSVYSALVNVWLLREERKKPKGPNQEVLRRACGLVALHLQRQGERKLSDGELQELLQCDPEVGAIETLDVGGRSLLNLTSDPSYRFAHFSIQEFLVAQWLVGNENGAKEESPLRASDQLVRFLFSWAMESPKERLPTLPLHRLDVEGTQGLGSVGLENQDLRGVELPRFLCGIDLSGADLRGVDLSGADLRGADLPWRELLECSVEGAQVDPIEHDGMVFILVPGGIFAVGTNLDLEAYGDNEAKDCPKPEHHVKLSPFWIGKYPVTNEQYARFLEANPGQDKPEFWEDKSYNDPEQPVVGVSWLDAMAYCAWAGLTLPSEAQWEAAARGEDGRTYPWGEAEPTRELANYSGGEGRPTPVGAYPKGAGPYGTLDQAGNVWEWCLDEFSGTAYKGRDGKHDPVLYDQKTQGKSAADRVVRGGSWAHGPECLPAAFRGRQWAGRRGRVLGFRVVCASALVRIDPGLLAKTDPP